ncbi:hypothetical protein ACFOEY_04035 [Paracandidimonas soli]|uniref:hypothetical protein n=1 Tax=Paracandidimonas soli TaxID=1917182 RepID=UPI003623B9F1
MDGSRAGRIHENRAIEHGLRSPARWPVYYIQVHRNASKTPGPAGPGLHRVSHSRLKSGASSPPYGGACGAI